MRNVRNSLDSNSNTIMSSIEIPETIHQLLGIFYRLRIWSHKDIQPSFERGFNYLHIISLVSFMISLGVGAYTSAEKDERIFLAIMTVAYVVLLDRLWYIIWRKDGLLSLIQRFDNLYTEDRKEFVEISNKYNSFIKFIRWYIKLLIFGSFPALIVYPIVNEKHLLLFNIAFPLERSSLSDIGFWLAYALVMLAAFYAVICTFFINLCWYAMFSLSVEYKMLGNRIQRMGTVRTESDRKLSKAEQQTQFDNDLNAALQSYERIESTFEEFGSYFGRTLMLQLATSSMCICGAVYAIAFSSHRYWAQDVYSIAFITYCIFDIFMVTYLGNEIMLASDALSNCLYECDWIEQTQSSKKSIIIFTERLKRPYELVVGKIYPLNLVTFTSIVNSAYSMFNILQSMRK